MTFLDTRNLYLDNADIGVKKTEDNFSYEKLARRDCQLFKYLVIYIVKIFIYFLIIFYCSTIIRLNFRLVGDALCLILKELLQMF